MAVARYIALLAGKLKEVTGLIQSAGPSDGEKIVATDTNGRLHMSIMPVGVVAEVSVIEASENLSAGNYVNVYDDAGTSKVRKADASNGREAHGYVLAAVTTGQTATVYHEGANDQLTSLTAGTRYYLSATTPGEVSASPVAAPNLHQFLGTAVSATKIPFEADDIVERV